MKSIANIFQALRGSFYWDKALNATTQKQYEEGLGYISKIEAISSSMLNAQLLKVYLLYSTQQDETCISTAKNTLSLIEESRYSGDEERYLVCYVLTWSNEAANRLCQAVDIGAKARFEEINLSRVQQRLKLNFPLRDHPHWVEV